MINKDKVNEILADMKEFERKKQEVIEAEVDKFLDGRLEYYVAMVLNGDENYYHGLMNVLSNDGCKKNLDIAVFKIEEALKEYDVYMCYHESQGKIDRSYINIKKVDPAFYQDNEVVKRQIELGLRPDMKKAVDLHRQWIEDEIKEIEKQEEIIKPMRKEKNGPSPIPIIFPYLVIIISAILFFIFK